MLLWGSSAKPLGALRPVWVPAIVAIGGALPFASAAYTVMLLSIPQQLPPRFATYRLPAPSRAIATGAFSPVLLPVIVRTGSTGWLESAVWLVAGGKEVIVGLE